MHLLGFVVTIFIGLLVGLFGGGGSILTVPVLVYLFLIPTSLATTYSLALVSITSLLASTPYIIKKQISYKRALQFGLPSLISLYLVRAFLLPSIPKQFLIGNYEVDKNVFILVLFSIIILVAGFFMIRSRTADTDCIDCPYNKFILFITGIIEGFITGIVGAGGGFIIVPILMIFGKLSMKQAVANSLLIIGIKSLIGFLASYNIAQLDFKLLLVLLSIAIIGMRVGLKINKHIDSKKLKPIFGYFVLFMGIFILVKELFTS